MIKPTAIKGAVAVILIAILIAISVLLRDDKPTSADVDAPNIPTDELAPAHFTARARAGAIHFSGHVVSDQDRAVLLQSDASVITSGDLEQRQGLPDHWSTATLAISNLMAATLSADATLSNEQLSIRAVVADEAAWREQLGALQESLPESLQVTADTVAVGLQLDSAKLCEQAFSELRIAPITFTESTTEFRNSAYPELERLAGYARECSGVDLLITGHTDSSGAAEWNQLLSEQRAAAVADFIAASGVSRARLVVSGKGATQPVATNATRYGRSKNRRIEIAVRTTPAFSDAPAQR